MRAPQPYEEPARKPFAGWFWGNEFHVSGDRLCIMLWGRNTIALNRLTLRAACEKGRSAMKQQNGRIGGLPDNINIMNPVPNKDAKTITSLIRKNGKVSGYELSDGRVLSKREGVALAKQGGIRGVAIASRNGSEYLRSLPDGSESNNLGDLPTSSEQFE